MAIIKVVSSGPLDTNGYFLGCDRTQRALFVDVPHGSFEQLVSNAEGFEVEAILLTHSHWDHMGDLKALKDHFDVPVYVHRADRPNVVSPGADGLPTMIKIVGIEPEGSLEEGQIITVGALKIEVITTPGHTPGGVCFYLPNEKLLFSGDTLFQGSIGILSLPHSNAEAMWASLKKLAKLPPETVVYPGHRLPTTIGRESWLPLAKQRFGDR